MAAKARPKLIRKKQADPLERFEKVEVKVRVGGEVRCVNCLRAARMLQAGEAEPENWTRAEAQLVLEAAQARNDVVVERLRRDGLLVGASESVQAGGPFGWLHIDAWRR